MSPLLLEEKNRKTRKIYRANCEMIGRGQKTLYLVTYKKKFVARTLELSLLSDVKLTI